MHACGFGIHNSTKIEVPDSDLKKWKIQQCIDIVHEIWKKIKVGRGIPLQVLIKVHVRQ